MAQTCRVEESGATRRSIPSPSTAAAPKSSAKIQRYQRCHAGTLASSNHFFKVLAPSLPGRDKTSPGWRVRNPASLDILPQSKKSARRNHEKYKVFAGNLCQFFEFQTNFPRALKSPRFQGKSGPVRRRLGQRGQHSLPGAIPLTPAGKFSRFGKQPGKLFHLPVGDGKALPHKQLRRRPPLQGRGESP